MMPNVLQYPVALAAVLLQEQVSGSMLVVTLVAVVCVAGAKKYA